MKHLFFWKRILAALAAASIMTLTATALADSKPGDTATQPTQPPQSSAVNLMMQSGFIFANPIATAQASIENPAGSGKTLTYSLQIKAEEYARVTGQPAPEGQDQVVFTSDPVPPGGRVDRISLAPLSDGSLLPMGEYRCSMLVRPEKNQGETVQQVFDMQLSLTVMADQRSATVQEDGSIGLFLFNQTSGPARFALVMSLKELREKSGLALYEEGAAFAEQDSMILLCRTDSLPVGSAYSSPLSLYALPTGEALPAGNYQCSLVRLPGDGSAEYTGCGGVALTVTSQAAPGAAPPALSAQEAFAYAQAAVNAQYLLSYEGP